MNEEKINWEEEIEHIFIKNLEMGPEQFKKRKKAFSVHSKVLEVTKITSKSTKERFNRQTFSTSGDFTSGLT